MTKLLIIGGVAAGATAAAKARRLSSEIEITMLEAGPDVSFANCGLPYYIGGEIEDRSSLILQSAESFWNQHRVKVHTNTSALKIDPKQKIVHARQGKDDIDFSYDKLILAQGGRPILPPLPGVNLNHVYTLWNLSEMDAIVKQITITKQGNAVIVGGGFIGLEMAEALTHRGFNVHLIEKAPHVMPTLDPEIAGYAESELLRNGVTLHKNQALQSITEKSCILSNGNEIPADLVLLSVGVLPTLALAKDAGLELGSTGNLQVNDYLQTSDPSIYAAGDMIEIYQRVNKKRARIPLAGPANRQGRIAAENALGAQKSYTGSLGTSVVRVFKGVIGSTGLTLKNALEMGLPAQAITVHKEHHTSYYPGAEPVTVRLVYNAENKKLLGAQTAGIKGAERRIDVLATAIFAGLTIDDLAELDLAYAPPLGTPNDAINMVAYAAQNQISQYSPSLSAEELDAFIEKNNPTLVDVRDPLKFQKGGLVESLNVPLEVLADRLDSFSPHKTVLLLCDTGKKAHSALRQFKNAGFSQVYYVSGGNSTLQNYALALGSPYIRKEVLTPVEKKSKVAPDQASKEKTASTQAEEVKILNTPAIEPQKEKLENEELIVDVRTRGEFSGGAYPGAINIPLDTLQNQLSKLGPKNRKIVVYCASGARSSYAEKFLKQEGFTAVRNGGGLSQMMMNA